MSAGNPFEAPLRVALVADPRVPGVVRCGAWLALLAEIGLPLAREGSVWAGLVSAESTRWLGLVVVLLQVLAASLLAWPCPPRVRVLVAAVGVAILIVVPGAHLGRLQQRFVDPLTRASLAGIELSQGLAAGLVLSALGQRLFAGLAGLGMLATTVASVALMSGFAGGVPSLGWAVPMLWLGGRLLRYLALLRLGLG